ncbi:MAG: hypothetical protein EXS63_05435 [Candidatus Omnitrophica bacterium]|nr:hypothetical protein [Candidatus Omnitrophota bacterium]
MRKIIVPLVLFFSLGVLETAWCSDEDFKINIDQPLGVIEASHPDPSGGGVRQCGLAKEVRLNLTFDGVKGSGFGVMFSDKNRDIYWYAVLGLKAAAMNNTFGKPFRIEWISPDGKIFHQQKFGTGWTDLLAKTNLHLRSPFNRDWLGRWRVKVWKKDKLIDDRYFEWVQSSQPAVGIR